MSLTCTQIKPGQVVKLMSREQVPADCVLIVSSEPAGRAYVETSGLDGETNLKTKQAKESLWNEQGALAMEPCHVSNMVDFHSELTIMPCPIFHACAGETWEDSELRSSKCTKFVASIAGGRVDSAECNANLYNWVGTMGIPGMLTQTPLDSDQVLLRGSSLRNCKWVMALVIYTGEQTKVRLNSRKGATKVSTVDRSMNKQLYGLFVALVVFASISAIGSSVWVNENPGAYYLSGTVGATFQSLTEFTRLAFLTALVQFSYMIPISLYVTMEIQKVFFKYFMDADIKMYHSETDTPALARTSNLSEDLGGIQYVFSDKTGTLTCNKMLFARCSILNCKYGMTTADRKMHSGPAPWQSPFAKGDEIFWDQTLWDKRSDESTSFFLKHLALCQSVVPETGLDGKVILNASSPDELALVNMASYMGFNFLSRSLKSITIDSNGVVETYLLLNTLEFNSTRKRMSVIVRRPHDGVILLLTKGADNIMLGLMAHDQGNHDLEHSRMFLSEFASEGLRTLVLGYRQLEEQEWVQWNDRYAEATCALDNREEKVMAAAAEIETGLLLAGTTAIEDQLQDGVSRCIQQLFKANIKVWMLTGDKLETADNIGRSCQLLTSDMKVIACAESDPRSAIDIIQQNLSGTGKQTKVGLIIEGAQLTNCLHESNRKKFVTLADNAAGVICCRVSPAQKAEVVKLVQENMPGKLTLSIGDGANDVAMIQQAHIGVGISGLEGLQAVNAADYAIAQFRFLEQLTLVHGRYSYKRLTRLINFSFHKNIIFTVPQILFIIISCWSGTLYQGQLSGLFNVLFSAAPILCLGIWEKDLPLELVLRHPVVYRPGQVSQSFNYSRFFWSMASAIMQGILIFVACVVLFRHDMLGTTGYVSGFVSMGLLAYTVVNFVVTLKVAMLLHSWTWYVARLFVFRALALMPCRVTLFFLLVSILMWFIVALVSSQLPISFTDKFLDIEVRSRELHCSCL
jgi:phospholipid-transporting ATPase